MGREERTKVIYEKRFAKYRKLLKLDDGYTGCTFSPFVDVFQIEDLKN